MRHSDNPASDPIAYLAGGPGEEALETIPFTFEALFAPYLANHDFIMFDQRGTGYSEPSLACPEMRQLSFDLLEQDIAAEEATDLTIESLIECRARLVADGAQFLQWFVNEQVEEVSSMSELLQTVQHGRRDVTLCRRTCTPPPTSSREPNSIKV